MKDKSLDRAFRNLDLDAKAIGSEAKTLTSMVIAGKTINADVAMVLIGFTITALERRDVTAKDVKTYFEALSKQPIATLTDTELDGLIALGIIQQKRG